MEKEKYIEYGTRLWDAAIIMVGHACLGAVIVVCMWGLEHLIEAPGHGNTKADPIGWTGIWVTQSLVWTAPWMQERG